MVQIWLANKNKKYKRKKDYLKTELLDSRTNFTILSGICNTRLKSIRFCRTCRRVEMKSFR